MKMIRELKCPYGDDFEGGDECDRCEQYELCMETYPPVNLIEIPKGATNGDIIKAMFPDLVNSNLDLVDVLNKARDWWNAPYKRGNENGSN